MNDQITLSASVDEVKKLTHFVNGHLEVLGCPQRVRIQVDVAIDEIFSNIVKYACMPETGPVTVKIKVDGNPPGVIISFFDRGIPYNPLASEHPDLTRLPKAKRRIGGLGLFLVKKIMDDVSYEYQDGQNILTIRKNI